MSKFGFLEAKYLFLPKSGRSSLCDGDPQQIFLIDSLSVSRKLENTFSYPFFIKQDLATNKPDIKNKAMEQKLIRYKNAKLYQKTSTFTCHLGWKKCGYRNKPLQSTFVKIKIFQTRPY